MLRLYTYFVMFLVNDLQNFFLLLSTGATRSKHCHTETDFTFSITGPVQLSTANRAVGDCVMTKEIPQEGL